MPAKLDLSEFEENKRLLVGRITPRSKCNLDEVYDVYLDGDSETKLKDLIKKKRRVFVNKDQNTKNTKVFGRIGPPEL